MRVVFFSNYLSKHQIPFCQAMSALTKGRFVFVATTRVSKERIALGYEDLNCKYPFVIRTYEGESQVQKALALAEEADAVVLGSAPMCYLEQRLKKRKLTFLYSERIYKQRYERWKLPVRLFRFFHKYGRHKNLYMLCASAYTAGDFAKTLTFINKTYKWGYFPEVKRYDNIDALIGEKKPTTIAWAGRFVDWKHPESVIAVAKRLKTGGYDFCINMIGNGELHDSVEQMIRQNHLEEHVHLTGAMSAEEVRTYMEQAAIYLFTSDRCEGWGAVLNESMNSACAVVASNLIGATPFLLEDGVNGVVYESGNVDDLYEKVKQLLDDPHKRKDMGKRAYETMTSLWNAEIAAERLLELSEAILNGNKRPSLFENGPCSKAERLKD